MKKILITGAAGFLGSHLCDRFINEGFYVIGMDNFITGDKRNIKHLLDFLMDRLLMFLVPMTKVRLTCILSG